MRLRQLPAGALALLLVAVQGTSLGHLLLERHEVCPEHGELIHADGGAHARGLADLAGAGDGGRAVRAPHASGALEHGDDHCTALAKRRELAVLPASGSGSVLPPSGVASPVVARADVQHEPRARYSVAPKQSPPA